MDPNFAEEILAGLKSKPKRLPSKFFYDSVGDQLFQKIMSLPEYYLTGCEFEILSQQTDSIIDALYGTDHFGLIEFGAGDGTKTELLLSRMLERGIKFTYLPIDISQNALDNLTERLKVKLPSLNINAYAGEYLSALARIHQEQPIPKALMFLGASIGNFRIGEAEAFLGAISDQMASQDKLLIGFDLRKDPKTILSAYNDSLGVTKAFNLNLLRRINKELDADFDLMSFQHYPLYEPESGEARSYLVSTANQTIHLKALNAAVQVDAWELIHTEISKKYSQEEIRILAKGCGFEVTDSFMDCKHYFTDSLWTKK